MNTESDTPRTDALMPDQGKKRTMIEHIEAMEAHARQLERELNDITKQRDDLKAAICEMMQLPSSCAYKLGKRALEKLTTETK